MSQTLPPIIADLDQLSEAERDHIARILYASVDAEEGEPDADFVAELDRRLEEVKSGKDQGKPAEQVFAELREKYPCGPSVSSRARKGSSTKRSATTKRKSRA